MDCASCKDSNRQLVQKLISIEHDLVDTARRVLNRAQDPFSGVIGFLEERPENVSLPGYVVNKVLVETFGDMEKVPALIRVLAGHVREIIRQSNVINIVNEHPNAERWGNFIIKQKEKINFEVCWDKGKLMLNNIQGLVGVEHGIELPLEKIQVSPPKLIVTVKLGLLRPQRVVDI